MPTRCRKARGGARSPLNRQQFKLDGGPSEQKLGDFINRNVSYLQDKRVFVKADGDMPYVEVDKLFKVIKKYSGSTDVDMRRTYNLGAGMTIVVSADAVAETIRHFESLKIDTYAIGEIVDGNGEAQPRL